MIQQAARFLSFLSRRPEGRGRLDSPPTALLLRLSRIIGGEVSGGEPGAPPTLHGGSEEAPWRLVLHWPYRRGDTVPPNLIRFESRIASGRFIEAWPRGSDHPGLAARDVHPVIPTDHPGFDATWQIRAADASFVRVTFSHHFRATLARMTELGHGAPLRFDLFPGKAVFQKEERIDDLLILRRFIIEAQAAAGLLRAALVEHPAPPAGSADCPVCATPVQADPLPCGRCRRPHHGECWTFNGSCAEFDCGEIAPATEA